MSPYTKLFNDPFMGYDSEDTGQPNQSAGNTTAVVSTARIESKSTATDDNFKSTAAADSSKSTKSGTASMERLYDVICCKCGKIMNLLNVHYTFQCVSCTHERCNSCGMNPI